MKDTTRSAILAGLAISAVAFAAATLSSTVITGGLGRSGSDGGGGRGSGLLPLPEARPPGETLQVPLLTEILPYLAALAVLVFVAYVIVYWREALGLVLASGALVAVLFLLFQFGSPPTTPPSPSMNPGNGSVLGGLGGGGESNAPQSAPPPLLSVLVLGLVLVAAVVALFRPTAGGGGDAVDDTDDGGTDATAVGRAAGRAADRIEAEAEVENEVYRTWREMTELLDVDDPTTSTPGEFADAAVEAGLGRDDVDELTRLFEDVRYGDQRPSDEHERRAVTVFRRIEDRYAGADS